MSRSLVTLFVSGILLTGCLMSHAEASVVFVSSFASGEKGAIRAFGFDAKTGGLRPLHTTTDIENPFFLTISPDGQFLYAIDAEQFGGQEEEAVAAYSIQGRTGKLKRINQQSSRGTASCYLDTDATGRTVVVANYSTGSVAALPVADDGSMKPAASFVQHEGSSIDPKRQDAPYAHSIQISPDNRFALAADLGIDRVLIYRFDADSAGLSVNETQSFAELPPGSGPRHLTFHSNGSRVYVINELSNTVTYFEYGAKSGTLDRRQTISTLPDDFSGTSHCADLKITPDGRFLYGTNRGHDSIAVFRIQNDGRLEVTDIVPSQGRGPQNLLITPDGKWLLCANMPENNLVVFSINQDSGQISQAGEPIEIPSPSCIRWLP